MCSLIYTAPGYDCPPSYDGINDGSGEFWTIYLYERWHPEYCEQWGLTFGINCANLDTKEIYLGVGTLGNDDNELQMTPLRHELEHLKCDCDFHEGQTPDGFIRD